MLSTKYATYVQVSDPDSFTGLTTYTWGYGITKPTKWKHFTHELLKIVAEYRYSNCDIFVVLTENNKLLYSNHIDNDFVEINYDSIADDIKDIICIESHIIILTTSGVVYCINARYRDPFQFKFDMMIRKSTTINTIACGEKHVLALGSNGKVYSWGIY